MVNQITKRGTNEFQAGAQRVLVARNRCDRRARTPVLQPLVPGDLGKLRRTTPKTRRARWIDLGLGRRRVDQGRLFAYGVLSYGKTDTDYVRHGAVVDQPQREIKDPTWLVKMDWNITDNHQLEFTAFSDKQRPKTKVYSNTGSGRPRAYVGTYYVEQGGENYVAPVHRLLHRHVHPVGAVWPRRILALAALVTADGTEVRLRRRPQPAGHGGCPVILDVRPGYRQADHRNLRQQLQHRRRLHRPRDSKDNRDQFRIDAEWQMGDHLLRFGYDIDEYESVAGQPIEGGRMWRYSTNNGPDGLPNTGDEFDIVREQIDSQGATLKVEQQAYYIEDSWNITDNFLAYLGLRWDTFENFNGEARPTSRSTTSLVRAWASPGT